MMFETNIINREVFSSLKYLDKRVQIYERVFLYL